MTENVVKSLSGSDFRMADLLMGERPVTIYLNWPESKLFALQPVMKLLWGTFTSELKDFYDHFVKKHGKKAMAKFWKILFLIDEAGVTPVPELYNHVSTFNGRGMFFEWAYKIYPNWRHYTGNIMPERFLITARRYFFGRKTLRQQSMFPGCLAVNRPFPHPIRPMGIKRVKASKSKKCRS